MEVPTTPNYPISILVVDDQPVNLDLICQYIQDMGYRILAATRAQQALEIAKRCHPELILADVMMPEMDGFEFCRRLKADPDLQDIPLIFVTAKQDQSEIVTGFQVGAVDYLLKPIQREEIQTRIRTHVQIQSLLKAQRIQLSQIKTAQEQLVQSEKMAALGQVVIGVAHELNTPIGNGITASTHLHGRVAALREQFDSGKMKRQALKSYIDEAEQCCDILNNSMQLASELVRTFKEVVPGKPGPKPHFEASKWLEEFQLFQEPRLRDTQHKIVVDCPKGLWITFYRAVLTQILQHLVNNAIAHGYPSSTTKGHFLIHLRKQAQQLQLCFSDDGVGIASDRMGKIFDPFFTSRRGQGHPGLGLYVVHNIVVHQLQGKIHCEPRHPTGTAFFISLPLQDPG